MRSLVLALSGLLTVMGGILWLYGRSANTPPISENAPVPALDAGQFTQYARRPPITAMHPAYRVALLPRSLERNVLFPPAHSRLPQLAPLPAYRGIISSASNRRGQVVGTLKRYASGAWTRVQDHGFLWQRGRMYDLGSLPGYQISTAVALNDQGIIVGYACIDSFPADSGIPSHAVCWIDRQIRDLGAGEATAINNAGDIVGDTNSSTADFPQEPHALLWTHGYWYDLNDLLTKNSGWVLEQAAHVDNRGHIAGQGIFHGKPHTFLLTPHRK